MKGHRVYNFFSFLNFTFGAIYESCLWTHSIIIRSSCKTATWFWYFSWSFVNCYNIASDYFLLLYRVDHFLSQIIHSFHLCRFQSYFSCFRARSYNKSCCTWWFFYFNLNHFSLYDLAFLFYSNTYWSSKSLSQGLSFAHLQREDFWSCKHSKRDIFSKTFCHGNRNCGFSCAWLTSQQDSPPCNLTFFDHLKNNSCSFSSFDLADHTLGSLPGIQQLI